MYTTVTTRKIRTMSVCITDKSYVLCVYYTLNIVLCRVTVG